LCLPTDGLAQVVDQNGNEIYKKGRRKKRKNSKQGDILQPSNGFEDYGTEPILDYNDQKTPDAPSTTTRKVIREATTKNSENKDNINLNLEGLFGENAPKKTSPKVDKNIPITTNTNSDISFSDQENNKYYYNQALHKINAREYELAIEYLNKALKTDYNNKELRMLRGNALTEMKKFPKAIKDYNVALKADADDPILHYNMATTYLKMNKLDHAIQSFTYALNLKPTYILALQGRASAKTLNKDFEGAIADYNLALDENAFFVPAFKGRGVAKAMMSRYDDAINDFSYVIEMQQNDGMAYYYRGLAYVSNNQLYKGCADFDRAYQLNISQAYLEIVNMCNK